MKSIRESVQDVIAERILPWIERDGISKLLLPEQITPADCARPMRCNQMSGGGQHREHELAFGLTGEAVYCISNKRFVFAPGKIVLLPGGTLHAWARPTQQRNDYLDLDKSSSVLWLSVFPFGVQVQASRVRDDTDAEEIIHMYLLLDRYVNGLMARLMEEIQSRPSNYARVGRAILIEFMERCLRATSAAATVNVPDAPVRRKNRKQRDSSSASKTKRLKESAHDAPAGKTDQNKPSQRVQAAMEFIHSSYHTPITLDDIADVTDGSVNHLIRQFRAATGFTPMQYLQNVRITAAKELLKTDLKIAGISTLVGIEDRCYFSRLFRRITGISPLRYRNSLKSHKVV